MSRRSRRSQRIGPAPDLRLREPPLCFRTRTLVLFFCGALADPPSVGSETVPEKPRSGDSRDTPGRCGPGDGPGDGVGDGVGSSHGGGGGNRDGGSGAGSGRSRPGPADAGLAWVRAPRQARSQETLDRILDAAERLVAEKGFEDTTVADVVARAGSSVGAFYARFRDKDGLLYALYERYLAQATATADLALDPARWEGEDVATILRAVLRFLVSIFREQAGLIRAFVLRNHVDAEFRERQERLSHYVSTRLAALLLERENEIRHPKPSRAAAFGFTMIFSTIESAMLFGELRSDDLALGDDALAAELTRAYLAYLGIAGGDFERSTTARRPRKEKPA